MALLWHTVLFDINYSKSLKPNFFPTKIFFKLVDSGLNLKAKMLSLELKSYKLVHNFYKQNYETKVHINVFF